ncbi:RNA polymerase Rpc34 [Catenaria anguillulae PL171]|uniref:DNA-directed RNA polymerase III subunit RPC6 n=1 Tax=Catenaria anguillulae PL171 TaxID=765915 RepID=A0A1Y2H4P5_9FUNG|nr:RNA polymerase Rpc34 [Catenaria anguillulae PL171]
MPPKKLSVLEKRFLDALAELGSEAGSAIDDVRANIPTLDDEQAAKVMQALTRKNFIEIFDLDGVPSCRAIKAEEQEKVGEMDKDERLVYSCIKAVGAEGIWIRTLQAKTALHANVLNKALKKLEQRAMVKTVKSVKHGNKKLYMLYELQPSSEVTGGVWFTDQELDVDFVDTIARACVRFVAAQSFPKDSHSVFPLNYNGYPTLSMITRNIRDSRIANLEKIPMPAFPLLLTHDGMDEDLDEQWMYRAVRERNDGSGWSQMPCGVCPVRQDCSEKGAVNPFECQYMTKWLEFEQRMAW